MSNDTHMQLDVKYWLSDKPQIQKILQYVIPFGEQKKGRLLKMSSEVWGPNNKKEYADELRLKMKQWFYQTLVLHSGQPFLVRSHFVMH